MLRDITIGQYYPTNSIIHRLDARIKLIATFVYLISLFVVKGFGGYFFVGICLFGAIFCSKVPIRFLFRGIKSIMVIILFTVFLNVFLTQGERVLWEWGFLVVSVEGILMAVKMCIRLILLIISSSLLTLTTTPIQLTDGIEFLLKPFQKIGVPSHEIAMMMSISLRFIPTLLEETDKIIKAQQARGADFESGNLLERSKNLIPILVPLFISAFRRADELAMAMESRCYRGDYHRTRMNTMKFTKIDRVRFLCWRFIWGLFFM